MHKNVNKPVFIFSLVTLILAAAGTALRSAEINAAFDFKTGLSTFSPLTVVMMLLSCIAVAFYIIFTRRIDTSNIPGDYISSFHTPLLPFIVSIIALFIMLIGAYILLMLGLESISSAASGILALLAALSGVAGFNLSLHAFRKKGQGDLMLSAVIDVIFLCFWTVLYYRQEAANPVLIDSMYAFLGLCASTLAFFYIAGFTAGRPSPRASLLFSGIGIFFCVVALINAANYAYGLFFIALIIRLFTASLLLLSNKPVQQDEAQSE